MAFFRLKIFAIVLACVAAGSHAQPSDSTSANELLRAGHTALRQVDEDRAGELRDTAPAFVKTAKPREQFVRELREGHGSVGTVAQWNWAGVVRVHFPDGSVTPPSGQYANVDYATRLTDGKTVYEKVSSRLEPSGWCLTGYEPRQNQ